MTDVFTDVTVHSVQCTEAVYSFYNSSFTDVISKEADT